MGRVVYRGTRTASPDYRDGLIHEYKMDELSGAVQDSVGSAHATTTTVTTYGAAGKVGTSIEWDGVDDRVICPTNYDLSLGFTLLAWVNYVFNGANGTTSLFGQQAPNDNPNVLFFSYADPAAMNTYLGTNHNTGVVLNNNTWHHVGLTLSGTTVQFYLDGQTTASSKDVGALTSSITGNLCIGWNTGSWDADGYIDEVRLYNTALTQPQIEIVYDFQK